MWSEVNLLYINKIRKCLVLAVFASKRCVVCKNVQDLDAGCQEKSSMFVGVILFL